MEYLQHAAFNLCHYIERCSNPPRPFPDLLWRLISVHGHKLSLELKERICGLLFNRISKQVIARTTREPIPSSSDPILGVSRLNTALLATMFRCYGSQFPPGFLQRWAVREVRRNLSPTLDIKVRWNNLLLLSTHMFFGVVRLYSPPSISPPEPDNIYWRTIFMLGTINEALSSAGHDLGPVSEYVRGISYLLWQMWKENVASQTPQPIDVIRAYVSAFLRIAAESKDVRLKDDCFLYCQQHFLWTYRQDNTPAMKSQAIDTIVAYVLADISCAKSSWRDLYEAIAHILPDATWRNDVTSALLHYYVFQNINIAYDLYLYSKENAITASSSSIHALGLSLASTEQWDLLAPILENETFPREQAEQLLGTCLRVFQVRKHEYADRPFVALLGRIANELYAQLPPPPSLMYPLRYFFSIMIITHNPSAAVKLITAVHRTTPDFFTMRLVLRLAHQLVRRRRLSSAVELYNLFRYGPPSHSVDDIRRKLALKLSRSGSRKLARKVDRTGHGRSTLGSGRESLARAVDFRTIPLSSDHYRHILPSVALAPTHGPTIRHAVSLLIRDGRLFLARKLFRDSLPHLDLKTKTAVGNIILHGPMYRLDLRNRRLVRHVLRTKDLLVREFGFVPDRTTVNIILKAMLRWRSVFDASHVKQIFDQMVHQGYPVPDQWRHKHWVPFNTPPSAASGLSGMTLPPHISFTRHVRPMYKLFIKALYLRNDRAAAKVIIGILKMVEIEYMRESEKRNRARREGIVKKRLKMTK